MSKLWLAILPFFILLSSFTLQVFASDQALVKYEAINPDSLVYPLKRISEKVRLLFVSGGENKSKYTLELLNTRLNELAYIASNKKSGFLEETASRYNSLIGQIKTNGYIKNHENFKRYVKTLETLRDKNPANSAPWLILQQTIDTTKSIL